MTFDTNDPRLTAYALGEIDDAERVEVEALLVESTDARRFVEETRATAQLLTEHLRREPRPGLAPEQQQAIERTLETMTEVVPRPSRRWITPGRVIQVSIAASIVGLMAMLLVPAALIARKAVDARHELALADAVASAEPADEGAPAPPSPLVLARARDGTTVSSGDSPVGGEKDGARFASGPLTTWPKSTNKTKQADPFVAYERTPATPASSPHPVAGAKPGLVASSTGLGRGGQVAPQRSAGLAPAQPVQMPPVAKTPAAPLPPLSGVVANQPALIRSRLFKTKKLPEVTNPKEVAVVDRRSGAIAQQEQPQGLNQLVEEPRLLATFQDVEEKSKGVQRGDQKAEQLQELQLGLKQDNAVEANNEAYAPIVNNPFVRVAQEPLSTFSIDVDTASYANVRRFLNQNHLPPKDAVRIEELLNYFPYNDSPPTGADPFSVHVEMARCPWNAEHRLARIGLLGRPIDQNNRPPSNLVFLLDVSGSMDQANKLPLVKASLRLLVENMGENDRVAIVVYAGASGLVLPSTLCLHKAEILSALEQLQAGGSTNGGAGIQLAYDTAMAHKLAKGTNRVILATDGDFNVGVTSQDDLIRLIEAKARSGVFLSVLGFGMGNIKDSTLEKLADKGNGHYAYIDTIQEAHKELVEQMGATFVTIAKDVKIQIEFKPTKVEEYRLIGYENRLLRKEEFNDDTKDAGEIGAGHHVTALYEIVPAGVKSKPADVAPLKLQDALVPNAVSPESLIVNLRYKRPDEDQSRLIERGIVDAGLDYSQASEDFKFAAAVAGFGMLLRDSPYKGNLTYAGVMELGAASKGSDRSGYRSEFLELVRKAEVLAR